MVIPRWLNYLRVNRLKIHLPEATIDRNFVWHELIVEGRWGGGTASQDSLVISLCRSILGFLPRTVLGGNTPTPASTGL
jgi:hypothetical protein